MSAAARVPCCRPVDVRSKQRVFGKMKQQAGKGKAHEVYRVHPDNPSQAEASQAETGPLTHPASQTLHCTAQPGQREPTAPSRPDQTRAHRTHPPNSSSGQQGIAELSTGLSDWIGERRVQASFRCLLLSAFCLLDTCSRHHEHTRCKDKTKLLFAAGSE